MKNYLFLILLLSSFLLSGCAEPPLVIGQPVASTDIEQVKIY